MTELLAKAIERLSELAPEMQDDIAQRLLTDLPSEARQTPERARCRTEDDALVDACQQGWLAPPRRISKDPPPRLPVAPLQQLLDELRADRDGR